MNTIYIIIFSADFSQLKIFLHLSLYLKNI